MKNKTSWVCAVALGLSALPLAQSLAAPHRQTMAPAPTTIAPADKAVVTSNQTEAVMPTAPGKAGKGQAALTPEKTSADGANPEGLPHTIATNPDGQGRETKLNFAQIAPPPGSMVLTGSNPTAGVEFGMRRDEVASDAVLNLEFTPSPSLIPTLSQFKVYLNDELMGVVPFTRDQLGKKNQVQVPIDPLYITDFNQVRLEFIGEYAAVCQNPANPTLWMDIGRDSNLDVTFQPLTLRNDLAFFPVPFYDQHDSRPLTLPIVFPGVPDKEMQQAAGILASWFGAQSGWRGQNFPVTYNQLPDANSVIFATNDKRPDFLQNSPAVKAPTIEMIDHPQNPHRKLLVILGRDDKDLIQAVVAIAQGSVLFRGDSVVVNDVKPLAERKPYDAPGWIHTDRPVTFGELKTYPEQFQSSGMTPAPISVALNLPPDLYLLRTNSIDMDLNYRYTSPSSKDSSRMDVSLNNQFLQSFPLEPKDKGNKLLLRLPVLQGLLDGKNEVPLPALRLGASNILRFDFGFMNPMPGGNLENCITYQPIKNRVAIDDDSTLDFSKYYHFMAMPDLRAYANAGFPFSRMADLSDTLVVMPPQPTSGQVAMMLNALGTLGSQTGLAGSKVSITDDSSQIKNRDADLLLIGVIPPALKDDTRINLLVNATQSWVQNPQRVNPESNIMPDLADRTPAAKTTISANGPMGAIIGFQSPYNDQRSVVALMGDGAKGYELLDQAMADTGKRAAMSGSVVIVRDSGVNGLRVGDIYYVGHLPWFERLWYALSNHPVLLAIFVAVSVVLLAWVLWRLLRIVSRRRLGVDDE